MVSVISDFKKRTVEIEKYFAFLQAIEEKDAKMTFSSASRIRVKSFDNELLKVLKANMFLLLYNLVEASTRQALNEIYDKISSHQINYELLNDEIKKIWIKEHYKNFGNKGHEEIFNHISNIASDSINLQFNPDKIISGNIDAKKIRDFSEKYGFSSKVHNNAQNGEKLVIVKNQRNNLAHGLSSFSECGRNYTITDLKEIKEQVILYVGRILKNIDKYLSKNKFLKSR